MPLIIPRELPAFAELSKENVFVMHRERARNQDIRPLRILILNLMPTKIVTETQLARLLANSPLQVQLTFLQTATHSTTHRQMNDEQLAAAGVKPDLVRMSCGLEDKADLIADIAQALDKI